MWDQGRCGVGSRRRLPAGKCHGVLLCAHMGHEEMKSLMSWCMLSHQYFIFKNSYVCWVTGCPGSGIVWAQVMSLFLRLGDTNMRVGGPPFGISCGEILANSLSKSQFMALTRPWWGRMVSNMLDVSLSWYCLDNASVLVFLDPRIEEIMKLNQVKKIIKKKSPSCLPWIRSLGTS